MGVVVLLVVGGVFGMVAGTLERHEAQRRNFLKIVIGVVGALFGGLFLAHELGGVPVSRARPGRRGRTQMQAAPVPFRR